MSRDAGRLCLVAGAVFLLALVIRLWIFKTTGWGLSDDAFITMRIARNLAIGQGFEYNPGFHVQSSTSSLWALISAGAWWSLGEKSLKLLPVLSGVADSLTAGLLVLLAGAKSLTRNNSASLDLRLDPVTVLLAPTLCGVFYAALSTNALVATLGLETGLYCLVTVITFLLLVLGRSSLAALVSGLAILVRPDGLLLAFVVIAATLVKDPKSALKNVAIVILVTAPYLIFTHLYFGTLMPQTMTAKGLMIRSATGEWKLLLNKLFWGSLRAQLTGACFLIGLAAIVWKRRDLLAPLAWTLLYLAAFSTFAMWWPWYFPPAMIGYSLAVGLGVATVVSAIRLRSPARSVLALTSVALLLVALSYQTLSFANSTLFAETVYQQRKAIAQWVDDHTSSDATVMLEQVGIVGYYSQRRFCDYPGLVSREVTNALMELGRPIARLPTDPQVIAHLLNKVQPTILILREDQYRINVKANSLDQYHLIHTVTAPPEKTRISSVFQTMFILARNGDPRVQL